MTAGLWLLAEQAVLGVPGTPSAILWCLQTIVRPSTSDPTDLHFAQAFIAPVRRCNPLCPGAATVGLRALIEESGIRLEDRRIALTVAELDKFAEREDAPLSLEDFKHILRF